MKYFSFALVLIGLIAIPSCYFDDDTPYNNDRFVDGIMDGEYFNSFNASAYYYPEYYENGIYYPGELLIEIPLYFNGRFYGEYLSINVYDFRGPGYYSMDIFQPFVNADAVYENSQDLVNQYSDGGYIEVTYMDTNRRFIEGDFRIHMAPNFGYFPFEIRNDYR